MEFIRKWKIGFGYGEQSAESIHAEFNRLNVTYCRVKPNCRQLHLVMEEHNLSLHPEAKKLQPEIKKENLLTKELEHSFGQLLQLKIRWG